MLESAIAWLRLWLSARRRRVRRRVGQLSRIRDGENITDRRRPAGRRRLLLLLLLSAQLCDILLMLIVGFRESMAAGAVGDEIELFRARRLGGGLERGAAGIGDRRRRQAFDHIS